MPNQVRYLWKTFQGLSKPRNQERAKWKVLVQLFWIIRKITVHEWSQFCHINGLKMLSSQPGRAKQSMLAEFSTSLNMHVKMQSMLLQCTSCPTSLDPPTYVNGAGCMSFYTIPWADAHIALIHESSSRLTPLSISGSWAVNNKFVSVLTNFGWLLGYTLFHDVFSRTLIMWHLMTNSMRMIW
jgi:hypothetical protein